MALAEQAELIVLLKLRDQLTGPLATATAKLRGAESGVGRLGTAATKLGGAFSTAGAAVGGFIRGPLGILAGGALTFGVIRFLGDATTAAQEFGRASSDLSKLLDLPIESASRLSDTLDKFGLDADTQIKVLGRLNKNAQTLAGTAKAAAKFETEFGFSLRDANGQIVDANELLKRSADFFNSNATAAQKATVLTKLYGREWAKLIPLLSQGREGIEEEERTALTLTKQQLADLAKLRVAQRDFNDAWGDLQVIVGVELVPLFTKFAQGVTDLVQNNREGIRDFVGGLANAAQQIGDAVGALLPVGRAIADAWNAIPADFRKLLIAGFIGNKILKMTIGFDPLDILRKSITNAVLGIRAGVVNVTGGVVNGPGGAPGATGGKFPWQAIAAGFLTVGAVAYIVDQVGKATEFRDERKDIIEKNPGLTNAQALALQVEAKGGLNALTRRDMEGVVTAIRNEGKTYEQALREAKEAIVGQQKMSTADLRAVQTTSANTLATAIGTLKAPVSLIPGQLGVIASNVLAGLANVAGAIRGFSGTRNDPRGGTRPSGGGSRSGSAGTSPAPLSDKRGAVARGFSPGGLPTVIVKTSVSTDHRQNSQASSTQLRYGPTPAVAGAS